MIGCVMRGLVTLTGPEWASRVCHERGYERGYMMIGCVMIGLGHLDRARMGIQGMLDGITA